MEIDAESSNVFQVLYLASAEQAGLQSMQSCTSTHKWNVASENITGNHPNWNPGSPAVGYSSIQELLFKKY